MAKVEKTLQDESLKVKDKSKKQKKAKNKEPRRSRTKATISELKKVSWPTFGKTMKQTGMVISVVLIFMLVTLGIDSLLVWLLGFIPQ